MARLFILSGPSGVGKDSVRDLLIEWGAPVHFAVTATDRAPRAGEVDGRDYRFLSTKAFQDLIEAGGFEEHAVVYGQLKGVPRSEVEIPLRQGRDVLARVDVQGARALKRLHPDAIVILLAPPSLEEAARRLDDRHTDTADEQLLRRGLAATEMAGLADADYIVVNRTGELEATARRVLEIIETATRGLE